MSEYHSGGYLELRARRPDDFNYAAVLVIDDRMRLRYRVGGVDTFYDDLAFPSTLGVWYDVIVKTDGTNVTVLRKERDSDAMYESVGNLCRTDLPFTTTTSIQFVQSTGAHFCIDNIMALTDSLSTTTTLACNNGNELTAATTNGVATNYYYDYSGRQISKNMQAGAHSASYSYRYDSKLCTASTNFPDESGMTFGYDGLGKLRETPDNRLRWDAGWNVINLEDAQGGLALSLYSHPQMNPGAPMAMNLGADPATGLWLQCFRDNLGSARALRADDTTPAGKNEYSPYGSDFLAEGMNPIMGFTGKPRFAEIGLDYFPYRMYAPALGRWMMRDPAGMVDGVNLFAYVSGGPTYSTDPSGLGRVYVVRSPIDPGTQFGMHRALCVRSDISVGSSGDTCYSYATYSITGLLTQFFPGHDWAGSVYRYTRRAYEKELFGFDLRPGLVGAIKRELDDEWRQGTHSYYGLITNNCIKWTYTHYISLYYRYNILKEGSPDECGTYKDRFDRPAWCARCIAPMLCGFFCLMIFVLRSLYLRRYLSRSKRRRAM